MTSFASARGAFLAIVPLFLVGPVRGAQEARTKDQAQEAPAQEESELERLVRIARSGKVVVRPQAAERLVDLEEQAAAHLDALSRNEGLAALGTDLVRVLGSFDHPDLRQRLWNALGDANFPWRPAAAASLAESAKLAERERFDVLLQDPLALVRSSGIDAVVALQGKKRLDEATTRRLEALLYDADDRVRRKAALAADRYGNSCALYWVLEDLQRTDSFFSLPTGRQARWASFEALKDRFGTDFGYSPRKPHDDEANAAAFEEMKAAVRELCAEGPPPLPRVARSFEESPRAVLGIELRSCRRGEIFLRWDERDLLWIGLGHPERIELPKGTTAALHARAEELLKQLEGRFFGEPGCDMEQVHFVPAPSSEENARPPRPKSFRVNKGPDAVEGLRPAALSELARAMLASLPAGDEEDDLRARTRLALEAIGGSLNQE